MGEWPRGPLARTDPARAGLDPGRDLSRDQERATIAFNQIHEPTGKRIKYEKVVPGIGPVDRDEIVKGYRGREGQLRPARRRGDRGGQAREQEDARADPVRRSRRDRRDLLREALLRRPGRRPGRGGVHRAARGAARRRRRSGSASSRCAAANIWSASSRAAAAWCWRRCATPTRSTRRRAISATSATPSPTRSCSTSPTTLIEKKTGKFDPGKFHDRYVDALQEADREEAQDKGKTHHRGRYADEPATRQQRHRPDGGAQEGLDDGASRGKAAAEGGGEEGAGEEGRPGEEAGVIDGARHARHRNLYKKRDFAKTAEPKGKKGRSEGRQLRRPEA